MGKFLGLVAAFALLMSGCATGGGGGFGVEVEANPASCRALAENPHPSFQNPGEVHGAVVQKDCNVPVQQEARARLFAEQPIGFVPIGEETINIGNRPRIRIAAVAVAPCLTANVRVAGDAQYLWDGEFVRSREVTNTKFVDCAPPDDESAMPPVAVTPVPSPTAVPTPVPTATPAPVPTPVPTVVPTPQPEIPSDCELTIDSVVGSDCEAPSDPECSSNSTGSLSPCFEIT